MVEHWDNLQKREVPNPSGHSMTDGATEITDRNDTEANKTLARSIVEDVLVNGKVEKLAGYFNGMTMCNIIPGLQIRYRA